MDLKISFHDGAVSKYKTKTTKDPEILISLVKKLNYMYISK
jgi:hypothetical protein